MSSKHLEKDSYEGLGEGGREMGWLKNDGGKREEGEGESEEGGVG